MENMRRTGLFVTAVAVALLGAAPALGVGPDSRPLRPAGLNPARPYESECAAGGRYGAVKPVLADRIFEQLRAQDDQAAAELLERHIELHPADPVMLYNAACVQCRLGALDRSAAYFIKAVKSGFGDISHARRDPDLRALRGHAVFRAIVDARAAADEMLAHRQMEAWRQQFGDAGYRYEVDSARRLIFISSLDDERHADMRGMLDRQTDHLEQTLFPGTRDHVLVVIPNRQDAADLLTRKHVSGLYNHRRRELVTRGHPRAVRHELAHAIHHGHMDALGQDHPLWIQEGLASLYEDYEILDDGTVRFLPNDRNQQVQTLAANQWLMTWAELVALQPAAMKKEAFRVYPQLRSVMRFIAAEGHLESWYRSYVEGFDTDPTGVKALELAFGLPIEAVEAAWRRWLGEKG